MYGKANSLDAVKQFGSLIKEFHAKDGRYPDPNNPYELGAEVPIPTGEVNFPAVIAELKKQGFQGALTIECELNGARHDYVIKTREYLQGLLDNMYICQILFIFLNNRLLIYINYNLL